jgi:hypothetical protein
MAKAAIYAEEAKRLFVVEGFSLDAIVGMLDKKVSRKTLYNWKIEGQWEDKRREYLEQTKDLGGQIKDIVDITAKNAKAHPSSKTIRAMFQALVSWEKYNNMKLGKGDAPETDPTEIAKTLSPETLDYIKKALYGLS